MTQQCLSNKISKKKKKREKNIPTCYKPSNSLAAPI